MASEEDPHYEGAGGSKLVDIDDVFAVTGHFGRFQKKIVFLFSLLSLFTAFPVLQIVFVGAEPQYYCTGQDKNLTCTDAKGQPCTKFTFSTDNFTSIVSEWSLVCGQSYKVKSAQSAYMTGLILGAALFGQLSDQFGRLRALMGALFITIFSSLFSAFAPTFSMYAALRLFTGIGAGGCILVPFVLSTEVVGGPARTWVGLIMPAMFAAGIMSLSGLAFMVRDWRQLTILTSLLGVPFFFLYWISPESPRWLLTKGRVKGAQVSLMRIATGNGTTYPANVSLKRPTTGRKEKSSEGLGEILKYPVLRRRTLILVYSWFVNSATYYGLSMVANDLGSSLYINNLLLGLAEMPAYIILLPLLSWSGRRKPLCGFMIIAGMACFTIMFLPQGSAAGIARMGLALLGKMGVAASFTIIYIHSAELFPTVIRNRAMAVVTVAARIGGVISPFMAGLGDIYPSLQFLVFGLLTLTSGLLNLTLPETRGVTLPETVRDMLHGERRDERLSRETGEHKMALLDSADNDEL